MLQEMAPHSNKPRQYRLDLVGYFLKIKRGHEVGSRAVCGGSEMNWKKGLGDGYNQNTLYV